LNFAPAATLAFPSLQCPVDRRTFLARSLALPAWSALGARANGRKSIRVTLVPTRGGVRHEIVNLAIPFARGQLADAQHLHLVDDGGRELPLSIRVLEPWTNAPRGRHGATSIRSVQIQFPADVPDAGARVDVVIGERRRDVSDRMVPVAETLNDRDGLQGPRVLALLPPDWLCASDVVGPQTPAAASDALAEYDRFVARSFPGSLQYIDSGVYHHWLFDRTSTYYTQYVRTGDRRFLEAAYHCAHFVRAHTAMTGPDAGMFTLKGADVKYVYPRAMHIHHLLTGDDRALQAAKTMARFCLTRWTPEYRPGDYRQPPLGDDPEKDRPFWSTRHEAYGLLGVLHGFEMTGGEDYWRQIARYIDALASHQAQPPDGRPADGSWRQNWALYDPNESLLPGAASPWMTAILLSALFHAWRVTADDRIPGMVTRWCDFLDRQAFVADGSKVHYIVDCFGSDHVDDAPGEQEQGMERHSTELAYSFAMGRFFSRDPRQRERFTRRFDRLFARALTIDANRPARCYNWAFQASSQMVYFMREGVRTTGRSAGR
jgi:hypothetical protein